MENTCFQIIVENGGYNVTVWDCDAKFEFEVRCTDRGSVTIDGETYDFNMASQRIYFERYNKIIAQIDISSSEFAQISIGNATLHLRMDGPSSELTLETPESDPVPVLILESRWHENEKQNRLMRLLNRQQYYLVRLGNIPMDRVPLLKLIAICAYCIGTFRSM